MTESFSQLTESAGRIGLRLVVIAIIAVLLIRALRVVTLRLVQAAKTPTRAGQLREQQTRTMADLLHSIGGTTIIVVAVLMVMRILGFDIAPALATAGLLSVALAFGAQSLLKDLINGIFIVFEDQYSLGDMLQVNGETGRVEHLTLSRGWSQSFVDITVPAEELVSTAISILDRVATEFRNDATWSPALVDGPRVLGVEALNLDGTVIRLQVRTVLNRKDDAARELRRRIKLAFEDSEIMLSHSHNVSLKSDKPSTNQ